ncbi:helix-turn-helix domain-containing protein [Chitinophaga sp. SYP-B3965]|uniref:AraC family transcriptional regulator n=1 Tax=Chitinophaga sp. SYP-B3965 TaxID=2663120 RepID=UPI001299F2C8|nr:helix-turn-helix transcriptional regulator [Chitinophaga sp. SYP-B3965]MRG48013.1 helix-turn-helix domain-containing protein [Chitinophaga sp. SYP-B3965]
MAKRSTIPTHSLDNNTLGIEVRQLEELGETEASFINEVHRDDHYIFIFQQKGATRMMIDFKELSASGSGILCILPGQVHYGISMKDAMVWFLAVDGALVQEQFRAVFEESATLVAVSAEAAARLDSCFAVLASLHEEPDQYLVKRSMADVVIGLFAGIFSAVDESGDEVHSRTTIITRQFKGLLKGNYKDMKRPSAYAEALNISPSYLNEAVKATTGLPVSHWIQEEVIMEAKRLLFYTDNTIKQIADDLGFEDHTYFSRVFNRSEGMPPLAFRKKYRK